MITKRQVLVARKSQATHYRSNAYHARLCTHAHVRTHVRTGLPIEASTATCRRQGTKRVIFTNVTVQKKCAREGFPTIIFAWEIKQDVLRRYFAPALTNSHKE